MTVVHPISRGWISAGGTGARNYDEFAADAEITQVIAANPASALAIEMPHLAPPQLGLAFEAALPAAAARLAQQQARHAYLRQEQLVGLYRISEPSRPAGGASDAQPGTTLDDSTLDDSVPAAYGLFAMVDTDQISGSADEPGLVIRNEDVFIDKVRQRVALAEAVGHLLSPVLLLQTGAGEALHRALVNAVNGAGEPSVVDTDHVGRQHEVWPIGGPVAAGLLELAGAGELVVADGNHRSLAAQIGGLRRFLAVITTPGSVAIQPYHRLVHRSGLDLAQLVERLGQLGFEITGAAPIAVPEPSQIILVGAEATYSARISSRLRSAGTESRVDGLDYAIVERLLLGEALGLSPGDKAITYVGGDYPPQWLADQVTAGRAGPAASESGSGSGSGSGLAAGGSGSGSGDAGGSGGADLAILLAPVSVADFVAVNLARSKMPRKSTWFTPKARAGLVLAELEI